MRHLPGIRYDAFDIMSLATAVGGRPPTDAFQPVTAKLETNKGCNQGTGTSGAQRSGHTVSPLHMLSAKQCCT